MRKRSRRERKRKIENPVAFKLTFTNVSDKAIKFNAFDFHFSRIKGEVKAMPADSMKSALNPIDSRRGAALNR
jgi:hypothetical protein